MTKPITPDCIFELISLLEPSLSPDGKQLAFVKSKIDQDQMKALTKIWVMPISGGQPASVTDGPSDRAPKHSPDGNSLAFLRPNDLGQIQLWETPLAGGKARCLTKVPGGIHDVAWSPDSRRLAFTSDVTSKQLPDNHDPKKNPQVRVVRRIRYRTDNLGWREDTFRQLFVLEIETGTTHQITDFEADAACPQWSPDSTRIAFLTDLGNDRDITWHAGAFVIDAKGGSPEKWSGSVSAYSQGAIVGAITWSPYSNELAIIGSEDKEISDPRQGWLYTIGPDRDPLCLTDGSITPLLPTSELRWTADGHILFLADEKGASYLCEIPVTGGNLRKITGGNSSFGAFSLDAKAQTAIISNTTPVSPAEFYAVDIKLGTSKQLTMANNKYMGTHPPAIMEKFSLSRGNMEIESRLFAPPDFDSSKLYPLVVDIHGGPHGRFTDSFDERQQVLATAGYLVLAVNPRGSSSYGPDFAKAVLRDWGGEDYLDIMASVDEVCTRSYVDETNLGVSGYSYGGFMSSWIVGQTNRFKVAVVGAPCTNLSSMYGTSDIGISFGELHWGGMRHDALEAFRAHSPLTYAPQVETPVLLMHGEDDLRCPIEQSEQYFVALKRLGKTVEFIRFPGSRHSFLRSGHPRLRQEYLTRMISWLDNYLRPAGRLS